MKQETSSQQLESWVLNAQNGKEESSEKIFEHFFDTTIRFVSRKVEASEVEDITSEIWLKITKNLKKYNNTSSGSFSAWVFRIARNTIIDYYRTKKEFLSLDDEIEGTKRMELIPTDMSMLPDIILNQKYEKKRIHTWLTTLPEKQREVIELRFIEDLSHQEIAQILGKSAGNIRVIQSRALKSLKEKII